MRIHATPNLNGNTASDFMSHALEISSAVQALQDALCRAEATITHGRNYQMLDNPHNRRQRDIDLFRQAMIGANKSIALTTQIAVKAADHA